MPVVGSLYDAWSCHMFHVMAAMSMSSFLHFLLQFLLFYRPIGWLTVNLCVNNCVCINLEFWKDFKNCIKFATKQNVALEENIHVYDPLKHCSMFANWILISTWQEHRTSRGEVGITDYVFFFSFSCHRTAQVRVRLFYSFACICFSISFRVFVNLLWRDVPS